MTLGGNLPAIFVAKRFDVSTLMFNLLTAVLQPPSLFAICLFGCCHAACAFHMALLQSTR